MTARYGTVGIVDVVDWLPMTGGVGPGPGATVPVPPRFRTRSLEVPAGLVHRDPAELMPPLSH